MTTLPVEQHTTVLKSDKAAAPATTATPLQRLAKLALDHPELRDDLMPIIREAVETTDIYPVKIDHGYEEPLSGGTDVMKRLQNQLRKEQGLPERPPNPEIPKTAAAPDKPLTSVLRKPYYAVGDAVVGIEDALTQDPVVAQDRKLKRLVVDLDTATRAIHKHLEKTYLWD